jgi:hypothetical protein
MKCNPFLLVVVLGVVLSAGGLAGGLLGQPPAGSKSAAATKPAVEPGSGKDGMTPDKALAAALKALADAKLKLWDDYKIIMTRPKVKDHSIWVIWFVSEGGAPGQDVSVIIKGGKTFILFGL